MSLFVHAHSISLIIHVALHNRSAIVLLRGASTPYKIFQCLIVNDNDVHDESIAGSLLCLHFYLFGNTLQHTTTTAECLAWSFYFQKKWPLHTILDLWSFMSFQIALLFSMNLWILMWHMVVFDLSLFSWAYVQLKSEFNFDLLEYLETRFVKLEIINDCVYMVLLVDLICANKFVRQESHAWLKTKIPFVHNFTCQSDHLVQFACTHIVVQNKSVTATLMKSDDFVLSTLNS